MMTKEQIEAILERVRTWPRERQEDAANILLRMEEQNAIEYELTEDELADLAEAEKEAENGQFGTGEEMKALFDRYRNP